jgi:RimJ/RimL family protein N-acetyltransferase
MDTTFEAFDTTLRDGRTVHVRSVRPADEAEFVQAFERLDPQARYMRFMRSVRTPNVERLRKVLASFPAGGIGLVATVPAADGVDIVGSAVAIFGADRNSCEFAITVSSAFGGSGLATCLMNALIGTAKRRGVGLMEGYVLASNEPMLRLARRLGFSIESDPEDGSVRWCRLSLGPDQGG